jgi:hypothetical protein
VIYTGDMAFRIALFVAPAVTMAIAVLLLNWLEAGPGTVVAVLGVVAVAGGASFGVFADRLPARPPRRRGTRLIPHHVD